MLQSYTKFQLYWLFHLSLDQFLCCKWSKIAWIHEFSENVSQNSWLYERIGLGVARVLTEVLNQSIFLISKLKYQYMTHMWNSTFEFEKSIHNLNNLSSLTDNIRLYGDFKQKGVNVSSHWDGERIVRQVVSIFFLLFGLGWKKILNTIVVFFI